MNRLSRLQTFARQKLPLCLAAYMMLQPVLDILTSLCARAGASVTPGVVLRAALMAYALFHVAFVSRFPQRKWCLIYLAVLTGYLLVFLGYMATVNTFGDLLRTARDTVKVFSFPYVLVFLYALYREHRFTIPARAVAVAVAGYAGSIFLAYITGTGFASYNSGYGCNGWFFAANEISDTLVLSAPIALCWAFERLRTAGRQWKPLAAVAGLIFVCAFACNYIGTKVVFAGVLVFFALCAVWLGVSWLVQRRKNDLLRAAAALCACLLTVALYGRSPLNGYVNNVYLPMEDPNSTQAQISINEATAEAAKGTWLGDLIENEPLVEKLNWILSKRLLIIAPIAEEYRTGGAATKLLGLGYQDNALHERGIERLVEMDAAALLLRHGAAGLAVYYLPYLLAVGWLTLRFLRRLKTRMSDLRCCSYLYSVLLAFAVSFVTGHTLVAPAVSFFAAVPLVGLLALLDEQDCALPPRKEGKPA